MTDQEILEYIRGELSQEEIDRFLDWVDASDTHKSRYRMIRNAWDLIILGQDDNDMISTDRAYELVKNRIQQFSPSSEKPRYPYVKNMLRIAATIMLTFAASWYLFIFRNRTTSYHQLEVSAGQRVKLVLADSTIVWLAGGTTFNYPDRFSKERRHVLLNGEAQFHVQQDRENPFEVETKTHTVNVLGTEFNVYAYDEASHFETTVYTGSVAVHSNRASDETIRLAPGQKLSYDKDRSRHWLQNDIDSTEMHDRIEGYLIFNKTPFGDMAERLSRYYRKPIHIRDTAIASFECTGKFHHQEKLEKILEVVRVGRPFNYKITEDAVEITAQ